MTEVTETQLDEYLEWRRTFTQAERDKMAKAGTALPDGSFPIANVSDLKNAISAYGRAGNKAAAKAHIIKRAKALGRADLIPEDWRTAVDDLEDRKPKPGMKTCEGCGGSGKEPDGDECSDCGGTGEVQIGGQEGNSASEDTETRAKAKERLKGTPERRTVEVGEIRSTTDGGLAFSGYASITERSYPVGNFEETIARGAFKRTLSNNPDVVLLINHGEGGSLPLASTKAGTLVLSEDARGLKVDADLDPTDPDIQRLEPKMRRGDVDEMSFAFRADDDEWSENNTKRLIRSATIHRGDVSIVTRGANSASTASLRALVEDFELRAGKKNSAKDRAEIEDAIAKLQKLLEPEDHKAQVEAQAQTEEALAISVHRSELDLVKAKRGRLA